MSVSIGAFLVRWGARLGELVRHPGFRHDPLRVAVRIPWWAAHCAAGRAAVVQLRQAQVRLYLPPRWRGGGSTSVFLFRERYEPEFMLLERLLQPGMVFIDGGANTGAFTFAAARRVGPRGRVVAFEPGRLCFAALRQSARLNPFPRVTLRSEALSDRCGTARLYHHAGQENSFSLGADRDCPLSYDEVRTVTLDQAVTELGLERIDFLKLDVEGAQEPALRGGWAVVPRDLPHVLIENHQAACRRMGLDPRGAFDLLAGLGYRFFRVQADGAIRPLATAAEERSVLALHPRRVRVNEVFSS